MLIPTWRLRLFTFVTVAVLLAVGLPLLTPHRAAAASGGVTAVAATDSTIVVAGTASPGATVDIYALSSEQDVSAWSSGTPVDTVTAGADGAFSAAVPRTDGGGADRLYDKFVAISGGAALGAPRYVDDVRITPANAYPYPEALSKKGLQVQMTDDAEELGVQHAGINLVVDRLMQKADQGGGKSIAFVSGGRTFWFNANYVAQLDGQIKPPSDNGTLVNLILIMYRDSDPTSAFNVLVHPDASFAPDAGPVYAFNTKTAEGVAYVRAAMEFIADRWSRADEKYGRVVGYIVGNEVNSPWIWQNMGEKPIDEFLMYYERALRIVYYATRKAWSDARVYVSLDQSWNVPSISSSQPLRFYKGRAILDGLNALTKQLGDFPWAVADHPYPSNLSNPAFWNDADATTDAETSSKITFKNIEILAPYLERPEMRYGGQPRRIILSEQGCNTPGSTPADEKLQAACYALAYYKIRFLDGIDAFILHRHVDYKTEGGLRLGLWTWDDARPEPSSPGRQKVLYDVFKYIDTSRSLAVTDFAKQVIGISDWKQLIPNFDPNRLAQRPLPTEAGASLEAQPFQTTTVSDFSGGTQGWRFSDNATSVSAEGGALQVHFDALAKLWRGTDVVLPAPLDASQHRFLTLKTRVDAPAAIGTVYAKVKAYSTGGVIAEGVARLQATSNPQRITVDLGHWSGRGDIRRIKVWLRGTTDADWSGTFSIDDVALAAKAAPLARVTNLALAAVVQGDPVPGTPVAVTVTNNDLSVAHGAMRSVVCDGVALDPASFDLEGLRPGETRTYRASIMSYTPASPNHPRLCFSVLGRLLDVVADVPPPVPTMLNDFEDGTTQGWIAGSNVADVVAVTGFPNGPGRPHGGMYALDAAARVSPADDPKSVMLRPATPLDLSAAREVSVWIDSYGGVPGAKGYQAVLTLWSATDRLQVTAPYSPDSWNQVVADVSTWAGRSSITRIEVSMQTVGSGFAAWNPHFQIDDLGYYTRPLT